MEGSNGDVDDMDVEAVSFASNEAIHELGLEAKGDVFALKAFCQRHISKQDQVHADCGYDDRKRKLIEVLKKGKEKRKYTKTEDRDSASHSASSVKTRKTRKIILGWMHYIHNQSRFVTVRLNNGGGTRKIDLPSNASKDDIIQEGKMLFFPDGLSSNGVASEMVFDLASFKGETIAETLTEDNQSVPFTVLKYIEKFKLTQTRLYLTSKSSSSPAVKDLSSDSDDDFDKPMFDSPGPSKNKGRTWRMKYALPHEEELEDDPSEPEVTEVPQSSSTKGANEYLLIGTSEERDKIKKEQDDNFKRCLEEDQRNEKENNELLQKEENDITRLQALRMTRSSRIPSEPVSDPRVRVAVNHLTKGKLSRYFKKGEQMIAVYDWVGSHALQPDNFILCLSPGKMVKPADPVFDSLLYMEVADKPVPMSDDPDIIFKGFGSADEYFELDNLLLDSSTSIPTVQKDRYADVDESPTTSYLVQEELPVILLEDDEFIATEDPPPHYNTYDTINTKREAAFNSLDEAIDITVNKENIVKDLMSLYKEGSILRNRIIAGMEEDRASGDGVLQEVYSLFWDSFLSDNSEGDIEFTIPVVPSLSPEDYIIVGKIITHQFVLCGTFPVRIVQASIQQALFGHVSDDCMINSFKLIFPPKERECLANALTGVKPFPTNQLMDILEDYNIRQLPTTENVEALILSVATTEFVTKPYLCLNKIREGMGSFWDDVKSEEIVLLYQLCVPTASKVIASLIMIPSDHKEGQIFRWLERYIRGASDEIVLKFLRFCTPTEVLIPGRSILVQLEVMPPAAVRPRSFTCFQKLLVPKNYQSYLQLRTNMDFYLRDCKYWDLHG
ncbi:hypothetical protein QZH41_015851 [Actinostola sp. cb2023]|nr:hypothetical protein QZH41_015851 [Actinostola sp. cb2023]